MIDLIQAHFILQKIRPVDNDSGLIAYKNKVFYQEYVFLSGKNYAPLMCFSSEISETLIPRSSYILDPIFSLRNMA